jgi:DNA-binding transcriptional ArsR family regulator
MVHGALAALSSPRRQEILRLLWTEERAAGDISAAMPDVSFGAVSLQLKVLLDAGLVERRADGQRRLYRVRHEALGPVGEALERMWGDAMWRLKVAAELAETRRGPQPGATRRRRRRISRRTPS